MSQSYSENKSDHIAKSQSIHALFNHVNARDPKLYLTLPSTTWSDTEIAHEMGIFSKRPQYIVFENEKNASRFMQAAEKRNEEIFGKKNAFWNIVEYFHAGTDATADITIGYKYPDKIDFGFYDFCGSSKSLELWLPSHLPAFKTGADICFTFWIDHCGRMSPNDITYHKALKLYRDRSRDLAKKNGIDFADRAHFDKCDHDVFGECEFRLNTLFSIKNQIQIIIDRLRGIGLQTDYFNYYREHSDNAQEQTGKSVMASFHCIKQ